MKNYLKSTLVAGCALFMAMGIGAFFNDTPLAERLMLTLVCVIGGAAGIWLFCFSEQFKDTGLDRRPFTADLLARSALIAVFFLGAFIYLRRTNWEGLVPGAKGIIMGGAVIFPLLFIYHAYLYLKQRRDNDKH